VYGEPYGMGDVIGITLNMDEDTISYTKNGTDFGVAYSGEFNGNK
jgi:ATP-dependent RNA helicase DDX1